MRISIINRHRDDMLGGSELQCDFIATELNNRGYEVQYIAMNGSDRDYHKPYTVEPCKDEANAIIKKINEFQPDVIYWRFNKYFFYPVARHANNASIKFIFAVSHINDLKPLNFKKKRGFRKTAKTILQSLWHHQGFRYVDALAVNNEEFLHILSIPNQVFIPNGMTEKSVPFKWEKPYCIWVANIKELKRPELYIRLASKLDEINVDFLMVGDIQEDDYLWIKDRSNLPPNIHYLGPKTVEEVNGILASSILHIHTCHAEGFPNVFIQAWMQGVSSVSYGFDPVNYISDYSLGFTTQENMDLFVEKVDELIKDPEKRDQFNKNAKKFASEMFQIEKSVSKLEKLIRDITEDKK